jgi:hypothetical protein
MSVAVWTHQCSVSDTDVLAQLYQSNGEPIGQEIQVAQTPRNEHSPAVAMDATGNFVVVYIEDYGAGKYPVVKRFSSTGAFLWASGVPSGVMWPVWVCSDPDIASAANGDCVATCTTRYPDGTPSVILWGRFSAANGTPLPVNSLPELKAPGHDLSHARVAQAADGFFAIAYQKDYVGGGDIDVHLARFDAGATKLSDDYMDYSIRRDINPDVAIDDNHNIVVVYQAWDNYTHSYDVYARRVNSAGIKQGEFLIAGGPTDEQNPVVAMHHNNGSFVVAYDVGSNQFVGGDLAVREFSASNQQTAGSSLGSSRYAPAISMDGDGHYFLTYTGELSGAWDDLGKGIYGWRGVLKEELAWVWLRWV